MWSGVARPRLADAHVGKTEAEMRAAEFPPTDFSEASHLDSNLPSFINPVTRVKNQYSTIKYGIHDRNVKYAQDDRAHHRVSQPPRQLPFES